MWPLTFITKEQFKAHVEATIHKYGEKLQAYDLKKFNSNTIDPIKLIFDKMVYHASWDDIIKNEIFRQRDKSNNNDIGYFHQNIFSYLNNCSVPTTGWDVVFQDDKGVHLLSGNIVHTIYVEMKNKHNTMNSASAAKTYMKMQNQLLKDDDCACFLVEAIAKKSQDIKWQVTLDNQQVSHNLIRRVSIDKFYSLVTRINDAFYQVCLVLPKIIQEVVSLQTQVITPHDTVIVELQENARKQGIDDEDISMAMAIYLLGFHSYEGFSNKQPSII